MTLSAVNVKGFEVKSYIMTEFKPTKRPVVLCILDGWGIGDGGEFDAIASANTPCYDALIAECPNTTLTTFGPQVGLPDGQMGNSEVGHMNIGAGRVVMQYLPRITKAFKDNIVKDSQPIKTLIENLKESGKSCHILGLVSDGGVHAHIDHVVELARIVGSQGINTHVHAFTDGRDCSPHSGRSFMADTERAVNAYYNVSISSVCGRYFAMDRDNRWERVEKAYNAIVHGRGIKSSMPTEYIQSCYEKGQTDEFLEPAMFGGYEGIEEGDAIIFANFRNDRARQILQSLIFEDFEGFKREGGAPPLSEAIGMVEYSDELNEYMQILFKPLEHKNIFGEVVAAHGLKQMRMAETEKYPHVTFFFNSGREEPYEGEERILVNSPKVATYDLQPEMSAPELSEKLLKVVEDDQHDAIIVNFANTDMVGHTGSIDAARKAAESVDGTLCKLKALVEEKGGVLIVTADHGNADQMFDSQTNGPHTAHTLNPVPFIIVGAKDDLKLTSGKLADIAPTMLHFLGIEKPDEMDGESLVK